MTRALLSVFALIGLAGCASPPALPHDAPSAPPASAVTVSSAPPPAESAPTAAASPSAPPAAPAVSDPDPDAPPDTKTPFELRLRVDKSDDAPMLVLTLRNVSPRVQRYLHDCLLQPSTLTLRSPSGAALTAFDGRTTMKFDNTVYRRSFSDIAPGGEVELVQAFPSPDDPGSELTFCSFRFSKLRVGTYRAKAVWKSAQNTYFDKPSRSTKKLGAVWLGTLTSNEVSFKIP
ncbi:MAG: hypothetical protein U0359_08165 [Byssovorax sp.]